MANRQQPPVRPVGQQIVRPPPIAAQNIVAGVQPPEQPIDNQHTEVEEMGGARYYPIALCEKPTFYTFHLSPSKLAQGLVLRFIRMYPFIPPYDCPEIPHMTFLLTIGRSIYLKVPIDDGTFAYSTSLAELLAPYMKTSLFLPEADAKLMLVESVKCLITHPSLRQYTIVNTRAAWEAAIVDATNNPTADNCIHHPNDMLGVPIVEDWEVTSPEAAMRILYGLSMRSLPGIKKSGITMIVHLTVSICKRGTVSTAFLAKIADGINNDLNKPIALEEDVVSNFYKTYSEGINESTIERVQELWVQLIPKQALRLILTVQQIAGSGLTVYFTILRALNTYGDFPWARIAMIYEDEWVAYVAAMGLVGGNVFYGFKHDLGAARSTKYKSLGWVAKELLIRGKGEKALGQYRGWPRSVGQQNLVSEIILKYLNDKTIILAPEDASFEEDGITNLPKMVRDNEEIQITLGGLS